MISFHHATERDLRRSRAESQRLSGRTECDTNITPIKDSGVVPIIPELHCDTVSP